MNFLLIAKLTGKFFKITAVVIISLVNEGFGNEIAWEHFEL